MDTSSTTKTAGETPAAAAGTPHQPPLHIPYPDRVADPDPLFDPAIPENHKRNCGHTGPVSEAGRAKIAQNARKHGACSRTLILPGESEKEWLKLFTRWQAAYNAYDPDSLEYEFVLKTAQAEWFRLRVQFQYDDFQVAVCDIPPHQWSPFDIKRHELMQRYKNSVERAFQREFRLLEQYVKAHPKPKNAEPEAPAEPAEQEMTPLVTVTNSKTGESVIYPPKPVLFPRWPPIKKNRGSS
jgi:hypothetical protein